jgi:hypothetical protein
MSLTEHIEDLIIAYKNLPNGKERNKVVSKLEDAVAWSTVLYKNEHVIGRTKAQTGLSEPANGQIRHDPTGCSCPIGGKKDPNCKIHGLAI